jgi:type I restriction enzyme M protein
VVRLLVEMIEPYKGRVYDPCCGSGGMFVQSETFVEKHGGRLGDLSIYGQESNNTTWRLARMNLAIRGIEGNLGERNADTFHADLHKDLKADFILANPPFNVSDWGGDRLRQDVRWRYGIPPWGMPTMPGSSILCITLPLVASPALCLRTVLCHQTLAARARSGRR